ncbi:MAG: DUF1080 domain-containing protein [Planctomycetaceae bacterium]|nr:DUF1080 domain-containing protein [Planctomycetaceae bacterium]
MKRFSLRKSTLCCWLCILLGLFGMMLQVPGAEPPVTPTEPIILFDKDQTKLDHFYTYIEDKKYEDPNRVFTVVDAIDGAPAIRVSGEGAYGGLITKKEYANYRLVGEFRWGDLTWAGRKDRTRDSGILLHCFGPDGNRGGWLASIEFQIIEGGVGDILVVDGKDPVTGDKLSPRATCEITRDRDGETVWKQGGERKEFLGGRINWFGRDPDWDDVLGFRGKQDVESPGKEWTHIEYIAEGDTLKYYVNGVFVNEAFNVHPAAGKILFQTEGAEIYWRKIELHPLKTSK